MAIKFPDKPWEKGMIYNGPNGSWVYDGKGWSNVRVPLYAGTSGISGTSGTSGISGTSGSSGTSGATGAPGIDGTSGTSSGNKLYVSSTQPYGTTEEPLRHGAMWYNPDTGYTYFYVELQGMRTWLSSSPSIEAIQVFKTLSSEEINSIQDPIQGELIFNTDELVHEYFDGSTWQKYTIFKK